MAAAPPSRPRRAARRDAIRHELLGAFERLIEEGETFASLSVDRLATEAGISRSTFYVYFEDKTDLLNALADEVIEALVVAAEEWWQLRADIARPAIERALRGIVDVYVSHRAVMTAVVETAAIDASIREAYDALMARTIARFEEHITTGQASGSVTRDVTPREAAGWLTWMTERGLGQLVPGATPARVEHLTQALTDVVWNSLYRGEG